MNKMLRWNLSTYLLTQTHSAPVIDSDVATLSLSHFYHCMGGSTVMTTMLSLAAWEKMERTTVVESFKFYLCLKVQLLPITGYLFCHFCFTLTCFENNYKNYFFPLHCKLVLKPIEQCCFITAATIFKKQHLRCTKPKHFIRKYKTTIKAKQ